MEQAVQQGGVPSLGVNTGLFSQVINDGTRGNLNWHKGRCKLDIRNSCFNKERRIMHWNRLPRDVESPSLEVFNRHVDVTLGGIVWGLGVSE